MQNFTKKVAPPFNAALDIIDMNQALQELYESKWCGLVGKSCNSQASYPLLINVHDDYINAEIKVMIVGQETDGWEGELEKNDKDIASLRNTYYEYYHHSHDKNRRAFWNRKGFKFFKEELVNKFPKNQLGFIWNNVSKLGNAHRGGQPSQRISELECNNFNVFESELKILNPDVIIFTIGDRNIPVEHDPIKPVSQQPVAKVRFVNYPKIIAVRTYHPNARIRGGKIKFKNEIVNLITEECQKRLDSTDSSENMS